jgi:hypothetical protein
MIAQPCPEHIGRRTCPCTSEAQNETFDLWDAGPRARTIGGVDESAAVTDNPGAGGNRNDFEAAAKELGARFRRTMDREREAGAVDVEMWSVHEHGCWCEDPCEHEEGEVEWGSDLCWVLPSGAIVTTDGLANVCPQCHREINRAARRRFEPAEYGNRMFRDDPVTRYHIAERSVRSDVKFCSPACRQRAYRARRKGVESSTMTGDGRGRSSRPIRLREGSRRTGRPETTLLADE